MKGKVDDCEKGFGVPDVSPKNSEEFIDFRVPRKQCILVYHLSKYTANRPYVDRSRIVPGTKEYLWSPVPQSHNLQKRLMVEGKKKETIYWPVCKRSLHESVIRWSYSIFQLWEASDQYYLRKTSQFVRDLSWVSYKTIIVHISITWSFWINIIWQIQSMDFGEEFCHIRATDKIQSSLQMLGLSCRVLWDQNNSHNSVNSRIETIQIKQVEVII